MVLKTRYLILGSIVTLIAISIIQGYLIYNTYELKKKSIAIEARNTIAQIYSTPQVDSLFWVYRNDFLLQIEKYENKEISKNKLIENLKTKTKEVNISFLKIYNDNLKRNKVPYDIKVKMNATNIMILDSLKNKNILWNEEKDLPIFLLGENFNEKEGVLINNSSWQKDFAIKNGYKELLLDTKVFMNIINWENSIFKQMLGLLIISFFLFAFVILLLSYSIHNLIKQKRLAEIRTDFINNITHELKTPLSTLSISTKTLTKTLEKNDLETVKNTIQVIDRQNIRLQNLVDQVVNNSIGDDEIKLSVKKFYAPSFITEIVDDYKITLDDTVKLNFNFSQTDKEIEADKFYLGTAIINLISNAVKYGGTIIDINYNFDNNTNEHIITVKDNGIGIQKKHYKLIFEKFYRISEKYTHNYKGLGLGLYYSAQIVKAHKGNLQVESKINQGSIFTIKIPN